jgi:hypothetical protein
MALSCAIEEAWENIVSAFSAIEQSGRLYGPNSEEVRLRRLLSTNGKKNI